MDFEQNDLARLRKLWDEMPEKLKFEGNFGCIGSLLKIDVDKDLLGALVYFFDPYYWTFVCNDADMFPTIKEYQDLLKLRSRPQDKIYLRNICLQHSFRKFHKDFGLMINLVNHPNSKWLDEVKSKVATDLAHVIMAILIYGMVIFPKVVREIDFVIVELVSQVVQGYNPAHAILVETVHSFIHC